MQVAKPAVQYVTFDIGNMTEDTAMRSGMPTMPPKMIHPMFRASISPSQNSK
jgi:hypothetical protein